MFARPFGQAIFTGSYRPMNGLSHAAAPASRTDAPAAAPPPYRRGGEAVSADAAPAIQHPVDDLQRLLQLHVLILESFKLVLFCHSFHFLPIQREKFLSAF